MEKLRGERKRKYIRKNKNNKKKDGFSRQKSISSINKPLRNFVTSYINQKNYDIELLSEFIYPRKPVKTYTLWWDIKPSKPRLKKTHHFK